MSIVRSAGRRTLIWFAFAECLVAIFWLASAAIAGIYFATAGDHHTNRAVVISAVVLALVLLGLVVFLLRRLWGAAHVSRNRSG